VEPFRAVSAEGTAGGGLTVFETAALEEVVSALPDELREHAVRPANASNCRKENLVIEIER
jgi:hypothetical protein